MSVLRRDRLSPLKPGVCASAAGFGADAAMLMHFSMPLAFGGAGGARLGAYLMHSLDDRLITARATRTDHARRGADISAVKVDPNALDEVGHHRLAETWISADPTNGGAGVRFLDRADESFVEIALNMGLTADHRGDVH